MTLTTWIFAVICAAVLALLAQSWRRLLRDARGEFGYGPDGGVGPIADLTTLANTVPVASLPEGTSVYVISEQQYFRLALTSGATLVTGQVVSAFGGPSAARWLRIQTGDTPLSTVDTTGILVMPTGDSLTTGSAVGGPGGSLAALFTVARARGVNVRAFGPVANPAGFGAGLVASFPYEAWCAGYSGFKIEDITALFGGTATGTAPSPLIKTFLTTAGYNPDVICLMIGTNNAFAGESAASMEAKLQTLLAQITSICPATRVIVETIPSFYAPAAPTGGLAAANAVVAAYNAWILTHINGLANVTPLNPLYSAIDVAANLSQDTAYTDGIHLLENGQGQKGQLEATEIARLFPSRLGPRCPRSMKPRTRQPSANLPTKGTSQIVTGADNGYRLPAGNFLHGFRARLLDFAAGVNYVTTAYPSGGSFTTGWALIYNGTSLKWDFDFLGNVVLDQLAPMTLGLPIWVFVHGDIVNGTITLWFAMPLSQSAPGQDTQYVVACVGAVAGVAAWAQASANPLFSAGTDPSTRAGVAMDIDSIFFCATSASVPDVFHIRDVIEDIVFDGGEPPGLTASLPCNEGVGAPASRVGGSAGVLTGGWTLAGEIAWPSDLDSASTPFLLASVAMADANQVLPNTQFQATTIEATGALTADRTLRLPRIRGKVWTINNKTTGAHNVTAIGFTGTGVNCAAGISRVYFDGTNFVAA